MRISDWSSDVCSSDLTKTGRTAPSPGKSIQPLCGGYDSLSLDPPDHPLINLHIRAGRFDGSGEGFAMPFIPEAVLAALARHPFSLQPAARALCATAELRPPFGPAHRPEALLQRTGRNARKKQQTNN